MSRMLRYLFGFGLGLLAACTAQDPKAPVTPATGVPASIMTWPRSRPDIPLTQPRTPSVLRNGEIVQVGIEVFVAEDGTVQQGRIGMSGGEPYDEAVKQELGRWRFQPGTVYGKKAGMWAVFTISFSNTPVAGPPRGSVVEQWQANFQAYRNRVEQELLAIANSPDADSRARRLLATPIPMIAP